MINSLESCQLVATKSVAQQLHLVAAQRTIVRVRSLKTVAVFVASSCCLCRSNWQYLPSSSSNIISLVKLSERRISFQPLNSDTIPIFLNNLTKKNKTNYSAMVCIVCYLPPLLFIIYMKFINPLLAPYVAPAINKVASLFGYHNVLPTSDVAACPVRPSRGKKSESGGDTEPSGSDAACTKSKND